MIDPVQPLDVEFCRSKFPALKSGYIFADNAGGSQCLQDVVDRLSDYLVNTNVQLGADYSVSASSTNRVLSGLDSTAKFINCSPTEVLFGHSSTALVENLARALNGDIKSVDEFIITGEHESNTGPWKRLAKQRGLNVHVWPHTLLPNAPDDNPYCVGLQLETLLPLITTNTRIVAITATSNILGSIVDVEVIVKAIREDAAAKGNKKLEVCVDCVAYAPHRRMDVKKWDVDYAFFSYYKVYGLHTSVMYVRENLFKDSLTTINHHFLEVEGKSYMLQPGGMGYELTYAITGVLPYFLSLSPNESRLDEKDAVNEAFLRIAKHEQTLTVPLLDYLKSKRNRGVKIIGDEEAGPTRVPTISFVVTGDKPFSSRTIVEHFDRKGNIGIRWGHFYAYSLIQELKPPLPDVTDGVVRISLVHYNTLAEVGEIIKGLEGILGDE